MRKLDRPTILLISIMTAMVILVSTISILSLYNTALEENKQRLQEIVSSYSKLIESIAEYNINDYLKYHDNGTQEAANEATLLQVRHSQQHFKGFGKTGEFVIAKKVGDTILFETGLRHDSSWEKTLPFEGELAIPMVLALKGQQGVITAKDYRGVKVLAAYGYIDILKIGIVAKIDMEEIQAPYKETSLLILLTSLFFIFGGVYLFFRITKAVEEDLSIYKHTINAISDPVAFVDSSLKYVFINKAISDRFQVIPREIIGKTTASLFGEEVFEKHIKPHFDKALAGEQVVFEIDTRQKSDNKKTYFNATYTPFYENGKVTGVVIFSKDITHYKELQQKLLYEKNLNERYFNDAATFLVVLDSNNIIKKINKKAIEILECEAIETVGKKFNDIFIPNSNKKDAELIFEKILNQAFDSKTKLEGEIKTYKGNIKTLIWSISTLTNENNEIDGVLFSAEDISELKGMELIIKEKEQVMLSQAKYAAMGEMVNNIAHQWRQPINTIGLAIYSMYENAKQSTEDLELLKEEYTLIRNQLDLISKTIDDFRSFYKPAQNAGIFQVAKTVSDVYTLIEPRLKDLCIDFQMSINGSFSTVGKPNELKQVILNIYNNACDNFIEKKVREPKITLTLDCDDTEGTIVIEDNGGGIDEELLPLKLFEPFITTKGEKGTGIGLSLGKTIIEDKFKGKISAKNNQEGAEFTIVLPITTK